MMEHTEQWRDVFYGSVWGPVISESPANGLHSLVQSGLTSEKNGAGHRTDPTGSL
jgi:hypothetical protein